MNIEKMSPMMQQYFNIKKEYDDTLLFFRLGDFYEMFFSDALTASRELEITLTGRDCGQEERAPMCGVPFHSADSYITKLIKKGYKVAICEQITDPKEGKGIVERAVVRIITPGTFSDISSLDEKSNNYLASAYVSNDGCGVSFCDITTGDVSTTEFIGSDSLQKLSSELIKYAPTEIIFNSEAFIQKQFITNIKERIITRFEVIDDEFYSLSNIDSEVTNKFEIFKNKYQELKNNIFSFYSLAACFYYINNTQKTELKNITTLDFYDNKSYLEIDDCAKRNLELTETMRDKKRAGSLFGVLDQTKTSMGARLLKRFIEKPLTSKIEIEKRLNAVEELIKNQIESDKISFELKNVRDIERLLSKISLKTVNGRDLLSLKNSFQAITPIKNLLSQFNTSLLMDLYLNLDTLSDLFEEIDNAISEDAPLTIREGNLIKTGYNEEIDKIRKIMTNSKTILLELENKEREQTGIKNLKTGYNKVFGYYIEVTKSYQDLVPAHFIRKQTLANCERYITEELKEIEDVLMNAYDKINSLEYDVFCKVRDLIFENSQRIKKTSDIVSYLDVLSSFSEIAIKNNYTKPEFNISSSIEIIDGRHPVVEITRKEVLFVANDTNIKNDTKFAIITGPNMAGKSTYMRQVALICIMGQMGSFVPAKFAQLSILDKVFTRVGASDDLAMGQSTFMVEMTEVSNILKNATEKSLIILDEIGRGTSTYDGLSIAWAVVEYITQKIKAKTLFATHYHELTELEHKMQGVKNYCVAVKKRGDDITFLRRIIEGGADDSYGIEVAKLAGVPNTVIKRAQEIVKDLESGDIVYQKQAKEIQIINTDEQSFEIIMSVELVNKIKQIDITTLTPIEALNELNNIVNNARKI
jgi:DNA mismatch repair protein MutS